MAQERKPESLRQAVLLAASYVLARRPEPQRKWEKSHLTKRFYHDSHGKVIMLLKGMGDSLTPL